MGGVFVPGRRPWDRFVSDSLLEGRRLELVWGFSCQVVFWVVVGFLFEAGKPFFVPSPNDQVRGARRRGQGTETLAKLSGLPLSRACVSQRLDA